MLGQTPGERQTGMALEENSMPFGFRKVPSAKRFPRQKEPFENVSLWFQKMSDVAALFTTITSGRLSGHCLLPPLRGKQLSVPFLCYPLKSWFLLPKFSSVGGDERELNMVKKPQNGEYAQE